ncbi:MFS transporter, partial [Microcoleus sp. herbarium7]|uniref:MFS transporter n=1 Tax=Microcoleus sp. herbarium7 TaxID=3055435 RepID=UPI002FD1318A
FGGAAGNLVEWYDWYAYSAFALYFGPRFFPPGDDLAAALNSAAIFAVGFLMRPIGSWILGAWADKRGRKSALTVSVAMMCSGSLMIAVAPTYDDVGLVAPAILLLARLVQGLSVGGEYGASATFMSEVARAKWRGFLASFQYVTLVGGQLLALALLVLLQSQMDEAALKDWGWRIPFLMSIFLIIVSVYIRMKMHESPLFTKLKSAGKVSKNPLRESFAKKGNLKMVLLTLFGATAGQGVVWYTGQYYALTFLSKTCAIDGTQVNQMLMVAIVLVTPFFVFFGWLSDRIGRKGIMLAGMLVALLAYRPIYQKMYSLADLTQKQEAAGQARTDTRTDTRSNTRTNTRTNSCTDAGIKFPSADNYRNARADIKFATSADNYSKSSA